MSQNSQEKTCARVTFLIKLQVSGLFAKFLRTPFLRNTFGRLVAYRFTKRSSEGDRRRSEILKNIRIQHFNYL